jgi:hypothetical protein
VHDKTWDKLGMTPEQLRASLERHAIRARYAERSIALLYACPSRKLVAVDIVDFVRYLEGKVELPIGGHANVRNIADAASGLRFSEHARRAISIPAFRPS